MQPPEKESLKAATSPETSDERANKHFDGGQVCSEQRTRAMQCLMAGYEGDKRREAARDKCQALMQEYKDCKKQHRFDKCSVM